jgi:superfamily II DNA or RNA helicase
MQDFTELQPGLRYDGLVPGGPAKLVAVEVHGPSSATVTFRDPAGGLGESLIALGDLARIEVVAERRWPFDGDGADFRLAAEARRMQFAHLADPFAAVDTSNIDPYPHQIDAVYNRFLEQRPLRFLLADDPGAGKTVMSGLLIRELVLRGDLARCLIVAPGSLVEQWQDELWEKFGLEFEIMSRSKVEESRTGNPFLERNFLIARVDQLARAEDLRAKLEASEWDLVICDEAHKMSARLYGDELKRTRRFELGEVLRDRTRHLLLLTATPHNGKNEDFLAFMSLIDPERFTGRLRSDVMPDVTDVMRRLVKENLRTFEGTRLFPPRHAHTLAFDLSAPEQRLYDAVTEYVTVGMNRAEKMAEGGDKRRGTIVGFALAGLQRRLASSPDAIFHSLRRRHERLSTQAAELRRLAERGGPVPVADLPRGVRLADLEEFDVDDFDDDEREQIEDAVIDSAFAAATAAELDAELAELAVLVRLADEVRTSGEDTKWTELRDLLRSDDFASGSPPRKLLIFSEHKDTLHYVTERVRNELGRPDAVVTIHGGMKREDRRAVQDRFRVDPTVRVLVATDAAGEGVNLQVANLMVNYDLPWNPNRIEQRFGRIHRIGQTVPCHLWNLLASSTREGKVFERLFAKIEQQKGTYGDQVYDVLGTSHINTSLQALLIRAIREDEESVRLGIMDQVIEGDIGRELDEVLRERALASELSDLASSTEIRDRMESARARRLQPWFVEAFFTAGLQRFGGRITPREAGRFEVTRVPGSVRRHADASLGPVHDRYSRVTFDKRTLHPKGLERAELVAPGSPLLTAVVDAVLADVGGVLQRGAVLVDPEDQGTEVRLLVCLDHVITNGRVVHGQRQVVSRRFQYVEVDRAGTVRSPGAEPYLGYAALTVEQRDLLGDVAGDWANGAAEATARDWAIERFAAPHLDEVTEVTRARVAKVRRAVDERLRAEIAFWDGRCEEIKRQELAGRTPPINSGRARARADDLAARRDRRLAELALEDDLRSSPPAVVAAALVVPQGLLDRVTGAPAVGPTGVDQARKDETDRRAIVAVMAAERHLGRVPTEQAHNNPGFDIESVDPKTGVHYFIEVKGHLPQTVQIKVSAQQVQKAKSNPERWRLAVVSVPDGPGDPVVRYLVEPFADTHLHFAQPHVPLQVADLLASAREPS